MTADGDNKKLTILYQFAIKMHERNFFRLKANNSRKAATSRTKEGQLKW